MTKHIDAADDVAPGPALEIVPGFVPNRPRIEVYHKTWCPYSRSALALLREKGVAFEDIDVTHDPVREREMVDRAGGRTSVPEIFVDDELIGGYDELAALDGHGLLDGLIGADPGVSEAA